MRLFFIHKVNLFCNCVLKSLADFEACDAACGNFHRLLGLRIAAHVSGAILDFECAKANELNLIALCESFGNNVNKSGNCLLAVLLGHSGLFCNSSYKFGLIHYNSFLL